MSKNDRIVEYALDLGNIPPLTRNQKAELEALNQSGDEDIDYSDIPALNNIFWKDARRRLLKLQKTIVGK